MVLQPELPLIKPKFNKFIFFYVRFFDGNLFQRLPIEKLQGVHPEFVFSILETSDGLYLQDMCYKIIVK